MIEEVLPEDMSNLEEEDKVETHQEIENDFTYHAPKGDQVQRYAQLRDKAKELAHLIVDLCPYSKETRQALDLLNLSTMSANAAIARNE